MPNDALFRALSEVQPTQQDMIQRHMQGLPMLGMDMGRFEGRGPSIDRDIGIGPNGTPFYFPRFRDIPLSNGMKMRMPLPVTRRYQVPPPGAVPITKEGPY